MFKKILKSQWFIYFAVELLIGLTLAILMYLYQSNQPKFVWTNSFVVSGFLLFTFGWFAYINNEGLFSLPVYGVKAFLKAIVGKKMEKSYYDTQLERKKSPSLLYYSLWVTGVLFLLFSLLLYFIER